MSASYTSSKYVAWFLGLGFLIAFIWAAPFRDLYGIEARNALLGKEMFQGGIRFIPFTMGRPYPDYPPLYFWSVALFYNLTGGVSTLAAILPSALCAAGIIVITFLMGSFRSFKTGAISALVLGTFPEFWFKASKATIDMMLAFEVAVALFFLRKISCSKSGSVEKVKAVIGTSLAVLAALLTKGPIGIVLIGAVWGCYLLICKDFHGLFAFSFLYLLLGVGCVGIYFGLLWHEGGMALVKDVFASQVSGRFGGVPNKSFLYYEVYLLESTAPWWLWVLAATFGSKKNDSQGSATSDKRSFSVIRLSVTWFIVVLVIFSIPSSRHGRYLLPAFPALALIVSFFIEKIVDRDCSKGIAAALTRAVGVFFALFIVASWALYFIVRMPGKASVLWLVVWSVVMIWLWVKKDKVIPVANGIFQRQVVSMVAILSGVSLLVYPVASQRESGKGFVEQVEAKVSAKAPIVLFRIKQDGDGVKYALYSNRLSRTLNFVSRVESLSRLRSPCLLVTYKKNIGVLFKNPNWRLTLVGEGLIHHKPVVGYILEEAKNHE